jgi:hypothetical protein
MAAALTTPETDQTESATKPFALEAVSHSSLLGLGHYLLVLFFSAVLGELQIAVGLARHRSRGLGYGVLLRERVAFFDLFLLRIYEVKR